MKKKNIFLRASLITIACAAFTLICNYSNITIASATETTNPTQDIESTTVTDHVTIKDETSKKIIKNKKGKKIGDYKFHKPVLEGSTAAIQTINNFYKEQRISQIKLFKADAIQTIGEFYEENNIVVTDELTYEVTYNKNGYLCIIQSGYIYTGGAHGMPYRIAHTFDLNTGKEVLLKDVFQLTEKEMTLKIARAFNKMFKADTESTYWDDALKTVKKTANFSSPFYLTDKGVCFYYSPYDLACYARGFVETTLHYSSNKDILKIPALAK